MALLHIKNNILFVVESFFPSHRAGTEVYVLNLCHYFKKQGWKVQVLITSSTGQKSYQYEDINVHTFEIPAVAIAQELNGIIPPRGLDAFTVQLKIIQPDWVHFHSFGRAINTCHLEKAKNLGFKTAFTPHLGSAFCIKGNLRLFEQRNCDAKVDESRCTSCFIQSTGKNLGLSKVLGIGIGTLTKQNTLNKFLPPAWYQAHHRKEELKRLAHYADIIFAIAPWIQKAFKANGIHRAILIPQGISPLFFNDIPPKHQNLNSSIKFVFVGRMHVSKGFHLLKAAWEDLKVNSVELHVITNPLSGEADYFQTHKAWCNKQDNVIWQEGFSQQDIANYLNDMDVLILPSISNEVAPLVILEAATRNIPVLASDYIAMKDSIDDGVNGWLFENGNVDALKNKLLALIQQPQCILEVSSRIEKPQSMEKVAARVEEQLLKFKE